MKTRTYFISLTLTLVAVWLLWSGYGLNHPFLLLLGGLSVLLCLWIAKRMGIVDEEGTPAQLGIRPFTRFAPWLVVEIIKANVEVTKIVLSPKMPLKRNLIEVGANPKSDIGKVILANSITLTPGTVAVNLQGDRILVHALSFEGAADDLSGEMDRRVCQLEPTGQEPAAP
jgi:multicomponent Na+:H+ antiporter subunit E